jgi:hypothetical protein
LFLIYQNNHKTRQEAMVLGKIFAGGVSAGSARPTHLCFDGRAKLGRPYPAAKLEFEDGKQDCREAHPAFFLGALGAFMVKIKHHAAAGKALYL